MGFQLSPIIASVFMKHFEETVFESAQLKLSLWLRYVDDTLTLRPHDMEAL